jgi:hypothetical protein
MSVVGPTLLLLRLISTAWPTGTDWRLLFSPISFKLGFLFFFFLSLSFSSLLQWTPPIDRHIFCTYSIQSDVQFVSPFLILLPLRWYPPGLLLSTVCDQSKVNLHFWIRAQKVIKGLMVNELGNCAHEQPIKEGNSLKKKKNERNTHPRFIHSYF